MSDEPGGLGGLARETYVSLVTYRPDGSARPTPVWLVGDGDVLRVLTGSATAKARRARRDPRGTITPCDARGRLREGAPTTAVGVEVREDPAEVARTTSLLRRKHPVGYRVLVLARAAARMRPGRAGLAGEQVTLVLRLLPTR
ncbi:PPOX class F420-dependent oxidoreductase [Pseudokineococcus sp. 1T1Z-3]|uniref:PPOX class F420-dependent oxidoreductase n=1 Tax=Pseudokineococcus sp. 1T1Z-3 TaxID=3132745 RepID=UPI0030B31D66